MVVASNIAFLSEFIEIPASAQKWVIVVIPVLLAMYAFLLTAYFLSSKAAKSERMLGQQKRTSDLDHQTRKRSIMQIAEEELQVAELGRFLELVKAGKISAAEARAAILAGKTLGSLETEQRRDIDGDGRIGSPIPEVVERKNGAYHPR
jgi:Asp-tRNA(Asn)/Glu-tRNA(Gln) amidotransferase B subunit